jgi:hypothetical protein
VGEPKRQPKQLDTSVSTLPHRNEGGAPTCRSRLSLTRAAGTYSGRGAGRGGPKRARRGRVCAGERLERAGVSHGCGPRSMPTLLLRTESASTRGTHGIST